MGNRIFFLLGLLDWKNVNLSLRSFFCYVDIFYRINLSIYKRQRERVSFGGFF